MVLVDLGSTIDLLIHAQLSRSPMNLGNKFVRPDRCCRSSESSDLPFELILKTPYNFQGRVRREALFSTTAAIVVAASVADWWNARVSGKNSLL